MQNKWLMINIQNVQDFACQCLNRDVWSNEAVKNIIRDHFIFWQVRNCLGVDVWVAKCLGRWDSGDKRLFLWERWNSLGEPAERMYFFYRYITFYKIHYFTLAELVWSLGASVPLHHRITGWLRVKVTLKLILHYLKLHYIFLNYTHSIQKRWSVCSLWMEV